MRLLYTHLLALQQEYNVEEQKSLGITLGDLNIQNTSTNMVQIAVSKILMCND